MINNKRIINYLKITIMLLNELNLRALNINAKNLLPLPVVKSVNIEGREITFKITSFQSGYGSGRKTVISGFVRREDVKTEKVIENADIEKVRRVCASLCELTQSGLTARKKRALKETSEVEKLKQSLSVARRLSQLNLWVKFDVDILRAAFKRAREIDREKVKEALKVRAVAPILEKVAKLSAEERALLLSSLQ